MNWNGLSRYTERIQAKNKIVVRKIHLFLCIVLIYSD
jgi:hypothetical protein